MNEELKIILSAEIAKFQQNVEKAKKKVKDFVKEGTKDLDAFATEFEKYGNMGKKTLAVMGGAVAGAATALLALGNSTKEYRNQQAMLQTAFETAGSSAEVAKQTYNDLYRVLGDGGQATEAAQHLAKLTTEEKALSEWTNICQGVYATFGASLPIESLTEAVNHSAKLGEVQGTLADALEWSGVNMDEFNEQLFWCNSESEREKLIRDTLNGLYSDAAANYETNNAAILEQNEAQASLTDAMAALGEQTEPIMTMLTQLATDVLAQLTPHIKEFAEKYGPDIKDTLVKVGDAVGVILKWIADHWELVTTIATVIAGIAAALTVFSAVMTVVNIVMAPVSGTVLLIVAAIAALTAIVILVIKHMDEIVAWLKNNWQGILLFIANPFVGGFKLLYDNCDAFKAFIDKFIAKIKDLISKGFSWLKDKIVSPIKNAFNDLKGIVNKIKGLFDFEFKLPKLKVPKFTITPAGWELGDLLKGVKPSLGITWHARGGVFERPTLFNYGGSLHGMGENGAEAIVPLENNTEWINKVAEKLAGAIGGGSTPIVLEVDGKVFAKTAVSSINSLTRQQGKLSLNLV